MNKKAMFGLGILLLAVVGFIAATYTATYTSGAIETARIVGDRAQAIKLKGAELGLNCITNTEGCAELIARAEKNSQLKEAFLKAKSANVGILPRSMSLSSVGHIGEGYVVVNTLYDDEKIIVFLTK